MLLFLNQFCVNILAMGYEFCSPKNIGHAGVKIYRYKLEYNTNMLSKHMHQLEGEPEEYKNEFIQVREDFLTYESFKKDPKVLNTFKVPQLKQVTKYYRLGVSGTKQVLIQRIEEYFNRIDKCVLIQRIFRGSLIRRCFLLRGEGFRNRALCVNENDFYSLEPLSEIPFEYFFSFCCGKIWYGCNIVSLIHLIQTKGVVKNPYTREPFTPENIIVIKDVYAMICVVFGVPDDAPSTKSTKPVTSIVFPRQNMDPLLISIELIEQRIARLRTIRAKSVPDRIQTLFMEIDQLGNYTHSQWFSSLDRREYIRLFRTLFDIWSYRGQLTRETKLLICIIEDPFNEINRERVYLHEASIDVIKELCLRVMENIVYNGVDDEYRKIGALHVLTALTSVSVGARTSLPWLYEALYY